VPEVGGNTLVMAIQAVAREIRRLDAMCGSVDANANDQELLFAYERAAEELEEAYSTAGRRQINLPPYDELIAD
jgi:hypothetical protein